MSHLDMYKECYNTDVLFLIEHKDRELEVVLEIAKELKDRYGLSFAIGSIIYHRLHVLFLIRPKIVVFPSYGTMVTLFNTMYGRSISYVNLNWEQMLSTFNMEYRKPKGDIITNKIIHCAWGINFAEFLIANGVKKNNIYITGKPSMRILQKKYHMMIDLRQKLSSQYQINSKLKWLFFPLTCLHAFKDDFHVKAYINDGISEEMALLRRDYVSRTINIIFSWIDSISLLCKKKYVIILRPHPSISVNQYKQRFIQLLGYVPNSIVITKSLTAHDWLIASDLCFTNYSSLALDAFSIGKSTFLLEPEPFPDFLRYKWFEGFERIKNLYQLKQKIRSEKAFYTNEAIIKAEYDSQHNGIKNTAKVIHLAVLKNKRKKNPAFLKTLCQIVTNPRQPFGSFLRYLAVQIHTDHLIREGLLSDYFEYRDIYEMQLQKKQKIKI